MMIPAHTPGQPPEHVSVGNTLDELLKRYFMDKEVVLRCIGSQDHPNLGLDALANIVVETGTDRYDPTRVGVGYEAFARRGIRVDFYGEDVTISKDTKVMGGQLWEMYHSAIGDRGYGVHVDLVLIYDYNQLDMVKGLYDHHETSDGFVFKDSDNKRAALLGVIKILR